MADRIYNTATWRRLRPAILDRDGHRCYVPGCTRPATAVDHIVAWRDGGDWYDPDNLRAACTFHNSQRVRRPNSGQADIGTRRPSRQWL